MTPGRLTLVLIAGSIAAPTAAQAPSPASKEPLICRSPARTTGSRIRVSARCLTAEQWRHEDERKGRIPVPLRVTEGQNNGARKPSN